MDQIIVIPARMQGTRLAGKPLIKILDKSILWRVWNQCQKVHPAEKIFVATEDIIIKKHCIEYGINCIVTGEANTAIDRIKLFSDTVKADAYINVQGDEPLVNPKDILSILEYNQQYPERVVFGKTQANREEFLDVSKAKVVCDLNGRLLYSSRSCIPINNKGGFISAERAIWIYAFSKKHLDDYYKYKHQTPLERIEDNEIIRFLEIGTPVYCVNVVGDSWAVDEKKDLDIVEKMLMSKAILD